MMVVSTSDEIDGHHCRSRGLYSHCRGDNNLDPATQGDDLITEIFVTLEEIAGLTARCGVGGRRRKAQQQQRALGVCGFRRAVT